MENERETASTFGLAARSDQSRRNTHPPRRNRNSPADRKFSRLTLRCLFSAELWIRVLEEISKCRCAVKLWTGGRESCYTFARFYTSRSYKLFTSCSRVIHEQQKRVQWEIRKIDTLRKKLFFELFRIPFAKETTWTVAWICDGLFDKGKKSARKFLY